MRGRTGKPLDSAEIVKMFETTAFRTIAQELRVRPSRIRQILLDAGCDIYKHYRKGNPASLPHKKADPAKLKRAPVEAQVSKLAQRGLSDFEIAYQVGGVSSDRVREIRQGVGA